MLFIDPLQALTTVVSEIASGLQYKKGGEGVYAQWGKVAGADYCGQLDGFQSWTHAACLHGHSMGHACHRAVHSTMQY